MEGQDLFLIVLVALIVLGLVVFILRRPKRPDVKAAPPDAEARPGDARKPAKTALDDRIEVDAPVEIHEGMSLAEIKRAKAARIKGEKGRRETAVEATKSAREKAVAPAEPETPEVDDAPPEVPVADGELDLGELSEDISAALDRAADAAEAPAAAAPEPEPAPKAEPKPEPAPKPEPEAPAQQPVGLDEMSESYGTPLAEGLARTRSGFIDRLGQLFRKEKLDAQVVDEVEEVIYTADIGTRAARDIMKALEDHLSGDVKQDPAAVWAFVRQYVKDLLKKREAPLDIEQAKPFVILVVGVNGVGKTTTIGKMASKFRRAGKRVLIVAGDTFRAAAVEQIEVWGERGDIPVHTGDEKADPASVIFSGVERAKKEDFDVVICDTAGRLHTNAPLLDELKKVNRVTKKVIEEAPHETILVLDANTGQNAIQQAKMFSEAVEITGIVLTKLDGTAKGGVILGICDELDAPIRYIGIGESVADLRQFNAEEFVDALFM